MSFPQLYGLSFFWTFLVVLVALSLGACSTTIGKAPVYGYGTITVIEQNPYGYVRTPVCRAHGFPEAEGYYGCSSFRQ